MAEKTLIANLEKEADGTLLVLSPVVGVADGAPESGRFLNSFDRILPVKVLGERYELRLPHEAHGRIGEVFIPNECTPLAFGDRLLRLDPRALAVEDSLSDSADQTASANDEAGLLEIKAPSEGIFYRRSAPDAPAFVEAGSEIGKGSVLGLVEVMKCFNQITYGGPGLPDRGEVVEVVAEDNSEVAFGQVLFKIRPSQAQD